MRDRRDATAGAIQRSRMRCAPTGKADATEKPSPTACYRATSDSAPHERSPAWTRRIAPRSHLDPRAGLPGDVHHTATATDLPRPVAGAGNHHRHAASTDLAPRDAVVLGTHAGPRSLAGAAWRARRPCDLDAQPQVKRFALHCTAAITCSVGQGLPRARDPQRRIAAHRRALPGCQSASRRAGGTRGRLPVLGCSLAAGPSRARSSRVEPSLARTTRGTTRFRAALCRSASHARPQRRAHL